MPWKEKTKTKPEKEQMLLCSYWAYMGICPYWVPILGTQCSQSALFIQPKTRNRTCCKRLNQQQSFVFISKLLKVTSQYFLPLSLKQGGWILDGSEHVKQPVQSQGPITKCGDSKARQNWRTTERGSCKLMSLGDGVRQCIKMVTFFLLSFT